MKACVTVSIAFEIIIHHFSGNTVLGKKEDIDKRVLEAHEMQGGIPEFDVADPVNKVLHYLKAFGLAENPEHGYWRIKSVDDMSTVDRVGAASYFYRCALSATHTDNEYCGHSLWLHNSPAENHRGRYAYKRVYESI